MTVPFQNTLIDEQKEQAIVDYLVQHPDFFNRHLPLLEKMTVPHQQNGAVSLVERQIRLLREQNAHYRDKFNEFVQVAHENDEITLRLHRLTLVLMQTRHFDELINHSLVEIRQLLHVEHIVLKLFSADQPSIPVDRSGFELFSRFLAQNRPLCGQLTQLQLDYLFALNTPQLNSVALLPLKSKHVQGVLAIGSSDTERFARNKQVDFLQRLAEIFSAAISKP